jgi:hypothetical protein
MAGRTCEGSIMKSDTTDLPRDLVERLVERRDDLSVEAAEVIIGLRGALSRFRQWMRDAKELPNVQP